MSITLFFVDAFTSALDRGIASPNDIIRHVTPDVLATHLPRSLWARLLTACLGAPRVDASTIVDTVGIPNLCEHMPKPLLWTCLAEMAATALGSARISSPSIPVPVAAASAASSSSSSSSSASGPLVAAAPAPSSSAAKPARGSSPEMLLPPPPVSSRPASNPGEPIMPPPPAAEAEPSLRARTPTRPPVRGLGTSRISSQAGASSRRPQASAPATGPGSGPAIPLPARTAPTAVTVVAPVPQPPRRDELDFEIETDLRADWKAGQDPIPVGDDQLEDWSPNEETASGSSIDGILDSTRKR